MFVWCYASISLHAGDLWQILHVINLWVKISMLDSDGQIVLFVCGCMYKGMISSYLFCLFSSHYGWLFPSTINYLISKIIMTFEGNLKHISSFCCPCPSFQQFFVVFILPDRLWYWTIGLKSVVWGYRKFNIFYMGAYLLVCLFHSILRPW